MVVLVAKGMMPLGSTSNNFRGRDWKDYKEFEDESC